MASLFDTVYNPDVLTCLANLSNDEVFTPPELANRILDMLPEEIWSDPTVTMLDPFCKSGVFLREAAKRFIEGLEDVYPDLQERVDHIMHEQLFGIAITEMTGMLSRRSLYCSKFADGAYSVSRFDTPEGNIRFKHMKHAWMRDKCAYCGASKEVYQRDASLESHAYELIHTPSPERIFNMKFDVIVGNPPYQLNDGGGEGSSATPLYDKFIDKALALHPKYLAMIIPARWYTGGRGLDSFRHKMLNDDRMSIIHDFPETELCFPGMNIRGGVCYFLWDRNHHGDAVVYNHTSFGPVDKTTRPLLESGASVFIRHNRAISILKKVQSKCTETYSSRVYSSNPFGMRSNFSNYTTEQQDDSVVLYRSRRGSNSEKRVFVQTKNIKKNHSLINKTKVLVSKASPGGDEIPHAILSTPIISEPGSVSTETYLIVDVVKDAAQARNLISYMETRFFRFMVSLVKNTQNISKSCFLFVPVLPLDKDWNDQELYSLFELNDSEIAFIEERIKPMDLGDSHE